MSDTGNTMKEHLTPPALPHGFSRGSSHSSECCLTISSRLITELAAVLPRYPELVLSIGSGTGLLEAVIHHAHPDIDIHGVEVSASVNKYLPSDKVQVVSGTWDLCAEAVMATAWIFVYPREPKLVRRYVEELGSGVVRQLIWLGPKSDWQDYQDIVKSFGEVAELDDVLSAYELMVVAHRT